MNAQGSREVGRILGKAKPPPSMDQRGEIITAMEVADTVADLPKDMQGTLQGMRDSATR